MSGETNNTAKKRRRSLAVRAIGSTALALLVLGILIGAVGLYSFSSAFRNEYSTSTFHMARTAAALINGDLLDDYLSELRKPEYVADKLELDEYCKDMNVSLVYVISVDRSDYGRFASVFNAVNNSVDNTNYSPWELGFKRNTTNDEYRRKYRAIYEEGSEFETIYRTRTTDGQHPHITTLVPVHGSGGQVKGILCVQRPMRELNDAIRSYLTVVTASTLLLGLLTGLLTALHTKKQFVAPVERISAEAARFARENTIAEPLGSISRIDEISELAASIDTLEADMVNYMQSLTKVTAEKERINTELALAGAIQENVLPNEFPAFPDRSDFDIFASMTPARMVGGDFYNFVLVDDDHLAMWIADVSGKGIPAALFMMASSIILTGRTRLGGSPAQILSQVNNNLCEKNTAEMFVTAWLGILELSTGRLVAANAGHEYPVLCSKGRFELVKDKHGFVLGGMENMKYTEYELMLEPGDKLFVYSDGVPEATDETNAMFGTERMLDALNSAKDGSPEQVIETVKSAVDGFVNGATQFDDITMLCMEYKSRGRT